MTLGPPPSPGYGARVTKCAPWASSARSPTNVCGHPYSLQIRSHVSNVGDRSPASISRYSRTLTQTSQAARQTLRPLALPISLEHRWDRRKRGHGGKITDGRRLTDTDRHVAVDDWTPLEKLGLWIIFTAPRLRKLRTPRANRYSLNW